MAQSRFSLSWDAHKSNICRGLSALQQNGEFVDMTLAADGHLVKVHQVIIALASPYLKELISSAQCPHPVIFLNKVSYTTLCAILEYIYTGEVLVSIENLNELIAIGKELHITGLEDMTIRQPFTIYKDSTQNYEVDCSVECLDDEEICYFEVKNENHKQNSDVEIKPLKLSKNIDSTCEQTNNEDSMLDDTNRSSETSDTSAKTKKDPNTSTMQYTVSNQGSLQMILNRYVYYLKHANRDNSRQWRCVDYLNSTKCPAHVFTKDDMVVQRIAAHIHPFHDKKILKKVREGSIFSALSEAQKRGKHFSKNQININD